MKEIFEIKKENRPLKIIGNEFDSALYLNNELIQFTYLREIGSTWRYQIAKGISENEIIRENKFSNFVKFGYLTNTLVNDFEYIISILDKGDYEIEIIELDYNINILEINENVSECEYYHFDFYGGMEEIIATQNYLSKKTVEEYLNIIKSGKSPIVVLLKTKESENNTFIIDGHHKFQAYKKLKKNIKCCLITKLNSEIITMENGIEIFNKYKIENEEYKSKFLRGC